MYITTVNRQEREAVGFLKEKAFAGAFCTPMDPSAGIAEKDDRAGLSPPEKKDLIPVMRTFA